MMNYEVFKAIVAEQFLSYMPDEFAAHKVEIRSVVKVNQTVDKLEVVPPEGRKTQAIPSVSIEYMYERYQRQGDLKSILVDTAKKYAKAYKEAPQDVEKTVMENAKEKIVMMLINTEQNQELLKNIPSRGFQDLSIIYRIVVDMDATGIQTALVDNGLAERLQMSEQEMFEAAVINTKRIFPPVTKNMNDVIRDIFTADGMPEEIINVMIEDMPADRMMYVISNERGLNGAVSMLYENELHMLAESIESDLYILPSSIHETIAISTKFGEPYELAQMVTEINRDQVDISERLSNQVYHYDKDLRKLTLATDTPNKRLDGMVAEPQLIYEAKQSR